MKKLILLEKKNSAKINSTLFSGLDLILKKVGETLKLISSLKSYK